MAFVTKLWRGEASLGYTFWFFGVFMLFIMRVVEISTERMSPETGQLGFIISLFYYSVYSFILWRTADHIEYDLIYARLVRGFILIGWGRYMISANLLGGLV